MSSGKSTQLLQVCHDYEVENEKYIWVLKPDTDTKADDSVVTRMGDGKFKRKCDFLISQDTDLIEKVKSAPRKPEAILLDEAQFLSAEHVQQLAYVATQLDIPVICFGLKVDFAGEPFEGTSWLFALAQDIEEITTRALDRVGDNSKRGTMNMRFINGVPTFKGEQIAIDGKDEVTYVPVSLSTFIKYKEEWTEEQRRLELIESQVDCRGGLHGYR